MYNDANGVYWAARTNTLATPLPDSTSLYTGRARSSLDWGRGHILLEDSTVKLKTPILVLLALAVGVMVWNFYVTFQLR